MASPRDRLVEEHLHLVHALASKLRVQLGKTMEPGDLVAYGTKGLIEAADRFDPTVGVAFSTFAYYRIRGAMFDGMRCMGWYSRGDYARFRAEERAVAYLADAAAEEAALQKAAGGGAPDAATALEAIAGLLGGIAAIHITSLEAAQEQPDDKFQAPDEALAKAERSTRVRAAVAALPATERRLLELYYFADRSLEDAGQQLGLSKSWASRLHARAVRRLREALEGGEA